MTAAPAATKTIDVSVTGQVQASAEELLEFVAHEDAISFARLYEMFASRVFSLAHRVLHDPAQAEEVAQEVFVAIWAGAAKFDRARGSASGWIMTITHREAIDRVRHSQRSRERDHLHATADFQRDHDIVQDQVHHQIDQQITRCQIERVICLLTPLQQQAIRLAFYENYSYQAIGQLLGIPLATVKTRIRDGLIKIRHHLDQKRSA